MSKNVYVDFDGTLVDSIGCWQEAYIMMCMDNGLSIENDLHELFNTVPFDDWISIINEKYGFDAHQALFKYAVKSYLKRKPKIKVINEIKPINASLYIVSREPKELVLEWVRHYGLSMFEDIYQYGSERSEESFYEDVDVLIDDSLKYCIPAHKAGTYVIGVDDYHSEKQKEEMKKVCDKYLEED